MPSFKSLSLITIAVALVSANSASAGLFGSKPKPTVPAPATAAPALVNGTNLPAAQPVEGFQKATKDQVQAALRADPLTQSAFFNDQFEHDPTDAHMGLYLSNSLRSLGRYAEAADVAHRVLLFAPDNYDVLIAAARAHIQDNNAFFAVDSLQHALQIKPNDWQSHSLLGVAYDQIKRPDDAQTEWATALKLSPNNASVLTNLAMSKVTRGDFASAEPLLRTAAAQKDASLQIRQNLALVLGLEGKMAEAETLMRRDLPPAQADANLAWLQQQLQPHTAPTSTVGSPARSWDSVKASGS